MSFHSRLSFLPFALIMIIILIALVLIFAPCFRPQHNSYNKCRARGVQRKWSESWRKRQRKGKFAHALCILFFVYFLLFLFCLFLFFCRCCFLFLFVSYCSAQLDCINYYFQSFMCRDYFYARPDIDWAVDVRAPFLGIRYSLFSGFIFSP